MTASQSRRLHVAWGVSMVCVMLMNGVALGQFQMPDPRQMSGIPRPVDDLSDGTVSVRLIRGQLSNNLPGHPVELHLSGSTNRVLKVSTDENGRAQFSGLPSGATCQAVAVVDGERLESQQFPAPDRGGIRLLLVASGASGSGERPPASAQPGSVTLGPNTRFILEPTDEAVQVYYIAELINASTGPVEMPGPIVFEMQSGAQGTSVLEGSSPQALASGNRVTVTGPLPAGATHVELAYVLPFSGPSQRVEIKLPMALSTLAVAIRKTGSLDVSSPQIASRQEMTTREGSVYIMATGPALAAGSMVSFDLSGLPHHSRAPVAIALTLVGLISIAGIWAAASMGHAQTARREKALRAKREQLFASLIRVEEERRNGGGKSDRLAAKRASLISQLERIDYQLDTGVFPSTTGDSAR